MGFLSNEMHPDDVCMNLFMSEADADTGKQDSHKSSQVSEYVNKNSNNRQ